MPGIPPVSSTEDPRALAGLRVIDCGEDIGASYCGRLLASHGAEVIKVERPKIGNPLRSRGPFPKGKEGPEASALHCALNVGKLGVTLDVRDEVGRRVLDRLLGESDVLIHDLAPKDAEALGLDEAAIEGRHPRLILTTVTPYGWTGPYRDYRGYPINCCAAGGVSFGIGQPGRHPLTLPLSLGSYQAALAAASGTMTALLAREITGEGQHVDVAEAEVWATIHTGQYILTYLYRGVSGGRASNHGLGLYPNVFLPCKDGFVCLICTPLKHWLEFLECMGNPEWTKNPRYRDRRAMAEDYPEEVDGLLVPWLMQHTRDELFRIGQEHHFPLVPALSVDEVLRNEHLRSRDFFDQTEVPGFGTVTIPGSPDHLSETPARKDGQSPRLGEHNRQVYCGQLGLAPNELAELYATGVV